MARCSRQTRLVVPLPPPEVAVSVKAGQRCPACSSRALVMKYTDPALTFRCLACSNAWSDLPEVKINDSGN